MNTQLDGGKNQRGFLLLRFNLVKYQCSVRDVLYNFTISGEFSFTTAFDPDSHGACHGDELIYLFEPFYSHNGDPGLGPLSGDDLGQKLMLFSSSQTLKTLRF